MCIGKDEIKPEKVSMSSWCISLGMDVSNTIIAEAIDRAIKDNNDKLDKYLSEILINCVKIDE